MPTGYGYPYRASDNWVLNYMIHNLTPAPYQVWITYDLDFIPSTAPAAQRHHSRCDRSGWTSRTAASTRCST